MPEIETCRCYLGAQIGTRNGRAVEISVAAFKEFGNDGNNSCLVQAYPISCSANSWKVDVIRSFSDSNELD